MDSTKAIKAAMATPGLCVESEMSFLYELACQAPPGLPMIELGTHRGRSTVILCAAALHSGTDVITIDNYIHDAIFRDKRRSHLPPEYHAGSVKENLRKVGLQAQIVIGDSAVVPNGLVRIGLLFIDSEHTRERFFKELDTWLPLLVEGGIAAFHDYKQPSWPEMTPAINERFVGRPDEWDYLGRKIWLIGFRRRR